MKDCKVRLKDGTIITGDDYDETDFQKLKSIFKKDLFCMLTTYHESFM